MTSQRNGYSNIYFNRKKIYQQKDETASESKNEDDFDDNQPKKQKLFHSVHSQNLIDDSFISETEYIIKNGTLLSSQE
jgi:hypothetical protein